MITNFLKCAILITLLTISDWSVEASSSSITKEIAEKYNTPALGYLISNETKTKSREVFGKRDFMADDQVTLNDKFHLGSNTKVMTSTVFAFLVEKGVFTWETKISDVIPKSYGMNEEVSKISFLDLFQHRSGLDSNIFRELWIKMWKLEQENKSGKEQRELFANHYLKAKPTHDHKKYLYSNVGYSLAGFLMEYKLKKSFEEILNEYLFKKLEMSSCQNGVGGIGHPKGHKTVDGKRVAYYGDNPKVYAPAGRVSCALEDWAKFARFHLNMKLRNTDVFKPIYNPPKGFNYAAGFILTKEGVLAHEGNNTLNHAIIGINPNKKEIILVVTNDGDRNIGVAAAQELYSKIRK
jgi:CubicO group peptidase (beta-lactamase class C family)